MIDEIGTGEDLPGIEGYPLAYPLEPPGRQLLARVAQTLCKHRRHGTGDLGLIHVASPTSVRCCVAAIPRAIPLWIGGRACLHRGGGHHAGTRARSAKHT